jgi:hypothetical protein
MGPLVKLAVSERLNLSGEYCIGGLGSTTQRGFRRMAEVSALAVNPLTELLPCEPVPLSILLNPRWCGRP